jgi:hypothetical protein
LLSRWTLAEYLNTRPPSHVVVLGALALSLEALLITLLWLCTMNTHGYAQCEYIVVCKRKTYTLV